MSKAGNDPYLVRWSILSVLSLQNVGSIPRSHQWFVQARLIHFIKILQSLPESSLSLNSAEVFMVS